MLERLPWAISTVACAALALSSSQQANSYQASVNTDLYQQSGDLQIAWMKPQDGILGNGLSLLAVGGAMLSLHKAIQGLEPKLEPDAEPKAKSKAKPKDNDNEPDSEDDEPDDEPDVKDETMPTSTKTVEPTSTPAEINESVVKLFELVWNHKKRHLLIPAETGAGKTTLLLGLMQYLWKVSDQTAEFYLSTTKPSPCLGLEFETAPDGRPRVINLDVTRPHTINPLIERLRWLQRRMQERQNQRAEAEATDKPYKPHRIIIIADEWNSTLALAKRFDKVLAREFAEARAEKQFPLPPAPYAVDELQALMESILLMGREDECAEWVFGQDHQVQNAGFNTGYQKSFGIIVPFGLGAMQALEQALIGRSPVLPMSTGKQILQQGYEAVRAKPEAYFVYSNLNGHEIVEMPYLPNIKRDKLNGKQQRPATTAVSTESEQSTVSEPKDPWGEE
ncbi:MAG: hypothetical protein KME13_24275 [Myxacorys californica WJT36-NPBG1]|jgi:hypothetical protein|nr:hypothetical protein [Myxacorys californica WJT36-NPBG1]